MNATESSQTQRWRNTPGTGAPYYNVNAHALQPQGPQQYTYGTNPRQTYPQQQPYPPSYIPNGAYRLPYASAASTSTSAPPHPAAQYSPQLQPSYPQPYYPAPPPPQNAWGVSMPRGVEQQPQLVSPVPKDPGIGLGLQLLGVPTTSTPVVSYYPTPPPEANLDLGAGEQSTEAETAQVQQSSESPSTSIDPTTSPSVPVFPVILMSRRHYRPSDPARAPGVMISPRARPPKEMLEKADVWEDSDDEAKQVVDVVPDETHDEELRLEDRPATPTPTPTRAPLPPLSTTDDWDVVPSASPIPGSPILSATIPTPSPPSPPPAPPVKKSWASLFSPPSTASAPARSGLPMSSVVGFSIPAEPSLLAPGAASEGGSANTATGALPPATRSALLALLSGERTTQPPTSPTTFKTKIPPSVPVRLTPRGLINTGNMCFANAVLQVLLCTRAFYALFEQMQGVLGPQAFVVGDADAEGEEAFPVVAGSEAKEADKQKPKQKQKAQQQGVLGPAPLVRATAAFLREFVRGQGGGSGSSTPTPKAKGKGKGRAEASAEDDEDGEAFIPTVVYDALKGKKRFDGMRGGHQEDAEEFLGFFLDTLEEELVGVAASLRGPSSTSSSGEANANAPPPVVEEREEAETAEDGWLEVGRKNRTVVTRTIESTDSPITRIFGGKFRSTLRAPGQRDSVIVEDWRALRLDIQRDGIHTVEDALGLISHVSTIQITPSTTTTSSSSSSSTSSQPAPTPISASQQVLIEALPPVLVLHLKRFCYSADQGGVVKVGKQIAFGPELEVPLDVMSAGLRKTLPAAGRQGVRYRLFGVIYHHGVSASGGHYTLDVLHPGRGSAAAVPTSLLQTATPGSYAGVAGSGSTGAGGEGSWVRIDDELVSDVRPADVFGSAASGSAGSTGWPTVGANGKPQTRTGGVVQSVEREREETADRCAYLLFYRRVGG
ncbi:hypothetical protein C8F01DRAFT_1147794 [Mycena amicta]|nr:hypothetical protein C8F01DRAFT_1147794 [Mycena amicta]